jgi:serine/threonine-protein kinase
MASPAAKPASRHRFDDLTLDPGRRCVWRGGEQIRLSSLTFELLRVLVEHAPNVVAHDALVDRTWGPHRIVTPENLAKRVMLLRQALGDDADKPRYVERVRSQGYRLIPDVVDATRQEAALSPAEPQVAAEPSRRVARGLRAFGRAALATGVLLLMASAGWLASERLPSREAVADVRSIAVLPFDNRSVAEEDAGFFASGIHDDLITRLAAIGDLKVTPRASVMGYRAQPRSWRRIGEELGVGVVLDGSVQRAGNQVRVNVQLIDARTEETIWGKSYDEELTAASVFAIQRAITAGIAQELSAKLTAEETSQLDEAPTRNMRALDLYMSGRDYERPPFVYWGMAAHQYRRAIEEDPQFALAHARLSLASLLAYYNVDGDRKRVETAKLAAETAVGLQPDLPIGRVAMAFYLLTVTGELQRASDELAAAAPYVQGEPQFFIVRAALNEGLRRPEQAAADRAAALALSPRDPAVMLDMAFWHSQVREYGEAESLVDRALDIRPDFVAAALLKAELAVFRDGDVAPVRKLSVADFAADVGRSRRLEQLQWLAALYERDHATAIAAAARMLELAGGSRDPAVSGDADLPLTNVPLLHSAATTLELAGEVDAARRLYLRGLEQTQDAGAEWRAWRAAFLAGVGRSEEALKIGRELLAEMSPDDALASTLRLWLVLEVFIPGRDFALATDQLDEYLSRPGNWSIEGLLPHPRYDPIRHDARFIAVVAKHRRP